MVYIVYVLSSLFAYIGFMSIVRRVGVCGVQHTCDGERHLAFGFNTIEFYHNVRNFLRIKLFWAVLHVQLLNSFNSMKAITCCKHNNRLIPKVKTKSKDNFVNNFAPGLLLYSLRSKFCSESNSD